MSRLASSPRHLVSSALPAVVACACLWAGAAAAHLGPQAGRFPFVEGGALVGGGTTWGVVERDGDGYRRVCEESLGTQNVYFYRRLGDGRVLAGVLGGLRVTDDGGCTWSDVPGFSGNDATAVAVVGDAPQVLFATTGRFGADNGVLKSTDGGATFQPTSLSGQITLFNLAVSDHGSRLVASGIEASAPTLRASSDGGAAWSTPPLDLSAYVLVRVLGFDEGDASVMLSALDGQGRGLLLRAPADLSSLEVEATFENEVTHFAAQDGARYAVVRPDRLFRLASGAAEYALVEGAALTCVATVDGEPGLWGCGQAGAAANGQFLTSSDGLTWTTVLGFSGIEEKQCPAGSDGAVCPQYLPDAGPASAGDAGPAGGEDGGVVDAGANGADAGPGEGDRDAGPSGEGEGEGEGESEGPDGCACASSPRTSAAPGAALAALAWLALRRRRGGVSPRAAS